MYQIHFETDDFVLIDKHPGSSIHNESGDGLIYALRNDLQNQHIIPVHRLDKSTSGLLLCAKHAQAASDLSQLFQHRQIEKYYLALSVNKPKKKQGLIKGDMLKSRNGNWRLSSSLISPAVTQFFSYGLKPEGKQWPISHKRLFILKPYTGKTHQLRVALKSLGAPILGDSRYGSKTKDASLEQKDCRMFLHAYSLCFDYKGEFYRFCCLPTAYKNSEHETITSLNTFITSEPNLVQPWLLSWRKVNPFRQE